MGAGDHDVSQLEQQNMVEAEHNQGNPRDIMGNPLPVCRRQVMQWKQKQSTKHIFKMTPDPWISNTRLLAQLSLHHNRPVQSPLHSRCCTNLSVDLPSSIIHEQDPEILKVLHLRKNLTPNLEKAFYPFPIENHGLRFRSADSHPCRFILIRWHCKDLDNLQLVIIK